MRTLYWAPRVLAIVFIGFVSLFALDAFSEGHGFWRTMEDFGVHIVPSVFMVAGLVLAWKHEWIGTAAFLLAGLFFMKIGRGLWVKVTFATPCFVAAWLFLVNWIRRPA